MEEKTYSKQDIERALEALKAPDPEHPLDKEINETEYMQIAFAGAEVLAKAIQGEYTPKTARTKLKTAAAKILLKSLMGKVVGDLNSSTTPPALIRRAA